MAKGHKQIKTKLLEKAIATFDKILKDYSSFKDEQFQKMLLDVNLSLGFIYLNEKDNISKALPYFLNANSLNDKYGSEFQSAEINKNLGYLYYRQSNPVFARNSFEKALNFYLNSSTAENSNKYVIQEQISNIGLCYYGEGNFEMAIFYFDSTKSFIENQMNDFDDDYAK